MTTVLLEASDALSRNDALMLERLCEQISPQGSSQQHVLQDMQSDEEKVAYHAALLVFRRQVIAARGNVVLRQRLLAAGSLEAMPWGR